MINNSQLIIEHISSSVMSARSSKLRELISFISSDISDKLESYNPSSITGADRGLSQNDATPSLDSKSSTLTTDANANYINTNSNINTNDINIFRRIYECFQNILYPLGGLDSETDFIFAIFNTNNPFNSREFKNNIRVQLSTQYAYTLTYSAKNDNYIFPISLFYLLRKAYKLLNKVNTSVSSVNYYLLPETITGIDQLSSILYLLNSDIIIITNSLYYIMSNMGFSDSTKFDLDLLPRRWPIQTINTISILLSNIFSKLFYSIFIIITSLTIQIVPFTFKQFTNNRKFIIYQDRPTIFNPKSSTNSTFSDIYTNPTIITASSVLFDKSKKFTVPFTSSPSFTWRDVFDKLNGVSVNSIHVYFDRPYIIAMDTNTFTDFILNFLNTIFIVRQDMIVISSNTAYLILNDVLYARPTALNTIRCLPGTDLQICSQSYIQNLHTVYNVDTSTFNLYRKHGSNYYDISIFQMINDAFTIYSAHTDNTCNFILNKPNFTRMHQYMYLYLIYKHLQNGNTFENNHFAANTQTSPNIDLLAFSIAINTQSQYSIRMNDGNLINVYNPDIDFIISQIEDECTLQFKRMKNKNNIDPNCRCLYRNGTTDLSPYCFDSVCKNSLNSPSTIYKKYECKYPTCSQAFDVTNILASSLNLNNITSQLNCGAVTSSNILDAPAKYTIFFSQPKLWWSIDKASQALRTSRDSSNAYTFTILKENDSFFILDTDLYNSNIVLKPNSKLPILVSLFSNQIYIKHKILNSLIFYDENSFIVARYADVNYNYTLTFVKK